MASKISLQIQKETKRIRDYIRRNKKKYNVVFDPSVLPSYIKGTVKSERALLNRLKKLTPEVLKTHAHEDDITGRTLKELQSINRQIAAKTAVTKRTLTKILAKMDEIDKKSGLNFYDEYIENHGDMVEEVERLLDQTNSEKEATRVMVDRYQQYHQEKADYYDELPKEVDVVMNDVMSNMYEAMELGDWNYIVFSQKSLDDIIEMVDHALKSHRSSVVHNAVMINNWLWDCINKIGREGMAKMIQEASANGVLIAYEVFYDDQRSSEYVNRMMDFFPAEQETKQAIMSGVNFTWEEPE